MKKTLYLLVILVFGVLTCSAQKKKSLFYDGIELRGIKGWTVLPAKDGQLTTITCYKDELQLQLTKRNQPSNFNMEKFLEKLVESQMEQNLSASKKAPRVKKVSEVGDGFINSIPAKYVDFEYTKGVARRIYIFSAMNRLFTITCIGIGKPEKSIDDFSRILSSFSYYPESNTPNLVY